MTAFPTFDAGDVRLESGATFRGARLAYKTYGTLAAKKDNAILLMTPFGAQHTDLEHQVANGRALDPDRYFIVIANLFGNGLSSSPGNLEAGQAWENFTLADNVRIQERALREVFGIEELALACGFSMGGMQALHWASMFPRKVRRFAAICATAKCSPHNWLFLEGLRLALTLGGDAVDPQERLRAFGRVFAGWAMSQPFYREESWRSLGFGSLDQYVANFWEANFARRHAGNLLAQIWAWQRADIGAGEMYRGRIDAALAAIEARGLMMPSATDMFMHADDARREAAAIPNAKIEVIASINGHRAGNPARGSVEDEAIERALKALLAA